MPALAVVVEGYGDVRAVPPIVGRIGNAFGINAYVVNPPIRVKGLSQLQRDGELERWILLAQSRPSADGVLFVIDVDENCPVEINEMFQARLIAMGGSVVKPVQFCLIKSEFETWFLVDAENLKSELPEYGWVENVVTVNPDRIRGAKEALNRLMLTYSYKETRDQEVMARKVGIDYLYKSDRCFKKLVSCVTGLSYSDLDYLSI